MINFFEQLSDKLFPQKSDVHPHGDRQGERDNKADPYDYNSITCLCGGSLIKDYQQGFKFCEICGTTDLLLDYIPEHSYESGPYTYKSYHPYKRSNHLSERLNEFTNNNFRKKIPRAIYNLVLRKYKKEEITPNLIRLELKKNKLPQYYGAVNLIYKKCTKKTMAVLSCKEISQINYLFSEVEYIFNQIKPQDRKAFLNYNFVICKLLQKIGREDCCEYFKQIKSSKRKLFHLDMWRKIEAKLPINNYVISG